jgi:ferric-dicitrate binding protein FerR (iron transport regulator)
MKEDKVSLDQYILNESFQNYVLNKTMEDKKYWEEYIKANPRLSKEIKDAYQVLSFIATRKKLPRNKALSEEVFQKLQQRIAMDQENKGKSIKAGFSSLMKYAALFLVILGIGFFVSKYGFKKSDYTSEFLEIIVPQGERSQVVLPDGTRVWLNSGSVFKYPVDFLKKERKVILSGEAFFTVKHDRSRTFSVELPENLLIKVLGTEFNVKCYPNEKTVEATLVKGLIHLSKISQTNKVLNEVNLNPNEKATYFASTQKIEVSVVGSTANDIMDIDAGRRILKPGTADLEVITAWKDDALAFKDMPFEEIAVLLERWYGMRIEIVNESLKKEKFTGNFANKETIFQILEVFNRSEPIFYQVNNKDIIIDKKN